MQNNTLDPYVAMSSKICGISLVSKCSKTSEFRMKSNSPTGGIDISDIAGSYRKPRAFIRRAVSNIRLDLPLPKSRIRFWWFSAEDISFMHAIIIDLRRVDEALPYVCELACRFLYKFMFRVLALLSILVSLFRGKFLCNDNGTVQQR